MISPAGRHGEERRQAMAPPGQDRSGQWSEAMTMNRIAPGTE